MNQEKYLATMYEMIADELKNVSMNFDCLAINHIDKNIIKETGSK